MSDQTSTLRIKLLAEGNLAAFEKSKEQSEALKESLEGLKSTLELFGVGFGFSELFEGIKGAVEYGSAIKNLAAQADISTDAFQRLSYAAAGVEVNQQDLYGTLNILSRNLAQAADGASKQNVAISELGLSTAELLAMPVEQQVEAIAKAYVNAADKGKAWADVIVLMGRNSARIREFLKQIAADGINPDGLFAVSPEALERLEQTKKTTLEIGTNLKNIWATIVGGASLSEAFMAASPASMFTPAGESHEAGEKKNPATEKAASEAKVAAIQKELDATIQALPQMVAARAALAQAIADEGKAYETPIEQVKRLRNEANAAYEASDRLALIKNDATAQEQALRLQTQAAKLHAEAFSIEAKEQRDSAKYAAEETEMASKYAQEKTKLLPVSQQLSQARQHETDLTAQLNGLDQNSLTYRQDHLKIEGQILATNQQVSALEEKGATAQVEQSVKTQEMQNKRESIALAAIEHDYNLTDTQKWDEKRAILQRTVTEQEQYIANMRKIANDPNAPQGARDKAANAAGAGVNSLAGTREELGSQGANPHDFLANFSQQLTKLQNQWGTLQQSVAKGLTGVISSGFSSLTSNISRAIVGAQTLGQAFRSVAVDIGETLVQAIVDMGVRWVATEAMKLAFGTAAKTTDTATTIAAAEAASLAWAVPAMLASVASFGAADIAGAAGLTGAIALAAGLGAAGFESGGYTGGDEGRPAGTVHGKEFVWSAPAVRAIGVGNLERAHQAALSGGGGVASGGGASGASGNIIVAMSPEDVARSQRGYVDSRVYRMSSKTPRARFAR